MSQENISDDNFWTLYAYVVSSKYRKLVIKVLYKGPAIPKEISRRTGKAQPHISRALKELKNRKLVTCINPQEKKGRIYKLTTIGLKVAEEVIKRYKNDN